MKKGLIALLFIFSISFLKGQDYNLDSIQNLSFNDFRNYFNRQTTDSIKDLIYANAYLEKAKREKDTFRMASAYCIFSRFVDFEDALLYIDSSILLYKKAKENYAYPAYSYIKKGALYYTKGKYQQALDNYLIAFDYEDRNKNIYLHSMITTDIGLLKMKMGEKKDALNMQRANVNLLEQSNLPDVKHFMPNSLLLLGSAYIHNGLYDSATLVLQRGIKLVIEDKNDYLYAYYLINCGKNLYYLKQYTQAIDSLERSKNVFDIKDNNAEANLFLGKCYLELNKTNLAMEYFSKVDTYLHQTNHTYPQLIEVYQPLINHYQNRNDSEKQLYYINSLLKFDSIIDANKQYLSENIKNKYDVPLLLKSKEKIIKKLNREREKSKKNLLLLLSFLMASLLVIFYFIRKSIIYKKRYNNIYTNYNNQVKTNSPKTVQETPKTNQTDIPTGIVNDIFLKLEKFENELRFTKKHITLNKLAEEFDTNTKYLSTVINLKKEMSFINYINNLRVEYAMKKIIEDKKYRTYTLEAIADEVGFNNSQSFANAFYKKNGINPSYFRKQVEKEG